MTTHLSPEEFVEALDGVLAESRTIHLQSCDGCRREVDELRALMAGVKAVEMPEPSPLFWERFSARVRVAVDAQTQPAPARVASWWARRWRPLVAISSLTAVATLAVMLRPAPSVDSSATVAVVSPVADVEDDFDPSTDESFGFVTSMASSLSWDEVMEVAKPTREATSIAISRLTPAQQAELVRLLSESSGGGE